MWITAGVVIARVEAIVIDGGWLKAAPMAARSEKPRVLTRQTRS